jgi:acetate kinase
MGYTPLDGLMMATRSGSIDPGILFHVMRKHGLSVDDVDRALNHESGLLGVSGASEDLRALRKAQHETNARRIDLALAIFEYRIRLGVATMAAALGGVDAIVFTAGIGEHDVQTRANVCANLAFLGVKLDPHRNAATGPDVDISDPASTCRVLVIHTREDVSIAREVVRVTSGQGRGSGAA